MRTVKRMFALCFSMAIVSAVNAGSTSGGTPNVPCYVDGKLIGTIPITQCKGATTRKKSLEMSKQSE
ncbi:hypothetical protein SAMN04488244_10527 [Vibrio hangzhouensis]|uniref:Uncharacterized protein n=1 Tax=Vibrio hangzhouensis TaxID=462991 RepID=A0A1H5VVT1_9VIBR|nr:hypothetical protein SAMN04488244_10527 [Vibrio hangzhouensis]